MTHVVARRPARRAWLWCFIGAAAVAHGAERWLDVPFVAQVENGCGPACVSMVMRYWAAARQSGPPAAADEAVIRRALPASSAKGAYPDDLCRYLGNHGFRAFVFGGEWPDLDHHLSKGRPLIVAVGHHGTFHYEVVVGIDNDGGILLVNDPARRKLLKLKRSDFEAAWNRSGRWTLLALPSDDD
jgi:predicted double-glycine peptidase